MFRKEQWFYYLKKLICVPKKMEDTFSIRIGGEAFQIDAHKSYHRTLKRALGDYLAGPSEEGYKVKVIPYSHRRRFLWTQSDIERLRTFLMMVHGRFPENASGDHSINVTLNILHYLDPKDEQIRGLINCLDDMQSLVYTRVGFNLYFFDIKMHTAFFFIKAGNGILGILKDMGYRFILKKSGGEEILNGLMFVLSHQLIWHDGLLLHAAAIQRDGEGILFLGLSGAGKSTIAALCTPDVCFSDDGVILKKEGDVVYAYRSPFTQMKHVMNKGILHKGRILKGFILEKHDANKVIPTKKNEVMNRILMHFIHFFKFMDDGTAQKGFYLVRDIVDSIPMYRLEFTKSRDIWQDIQKTWGRGES